MVSGWFVSEGMLCDGLWIVYFDVVCVMVDVFVFCMIFDVVVID